MPKRLFLLCILLVAVLILSACRHGPDATTDPASPKQPTTVSAFSAPLFYLYFSENSSYFKRVQGYEFRTEEGRYTAYFYMAGEEELYPVTVDRAWAETLTGFIAEYGMLGWDGFSGSATGLLDGTQFLIEFICADGTAVKASGYGQFPDGYGGASEAIEAHFMQLLPKDMRDW